MNASQLSFGFPFAAYFLVLIPIILILFWTLHHYRKRSLARFASPDLLKEMGLFASQKNRIIKVILLALATLTSIIALMDPKGDGRYPEEQQNLPSNKKENGEPQIATFNVKQKAHDVMFLVDASASMGVIDARIGKSRLDYAKEIIDSIVSQLTGESVSLYAFTSEVIPLVPTTPDYLYLRLMLDDLEINQGNTAGTDFIKTLSFMQERIAAEPEGMQKTLIILSDGGDTNWEDLKGSEKNQREKEILASIGNPDAENLRIVSIGIGSKEGGFVPNISYYGKPIKSILEEPLLKDLSEKGKGIYIDANEETPPNIAQQVLDFISQSPSVYDQRKVTQNVIGLDDSQNLIYLLFFQYPLGFAIFFLSIALIIPEARRSIRK